MTDQPILRRHRFLDALRIQIDVISTLMVRDMKTRFEGGIVGYIVAVGWPVAHVVIIVTVYTILKVKVPLGDDIIVFCSIGVAQYIVFTYAVRWIAMAVVDNRQILSIPRVKVIDLVLSKTLAECVTAAAVLIVLVLLVILSGSAFAPADLLSLLLACVMSLLLGVGTGFVAVCIVGIKPRLFIAIILFNVLMWALCGLLYLPAGLPEEARYAMSWNPLTQLIEWARVAYYGDYQSLILDKPYVLKFVFAELVVGFVSLRLLGRVILRTA